METFLQYLPLIVSFVSLALAITALRITLARRHANAADRALNRFSRFNEQLFAHPEFHDVFSQTFAEIKKSSSGRREYSSAKAFAWFVLNQMEGVYMDRWRGNLTVESFKCYDTWFCATLAKDNAVREFVEGHDGANLKFFAAPYQEYIRSVL